MAKLLVLLLVLAVLASMPRVHLMVAGPRRSDPIQPQKIHMTGVRVTGYRADGSVANTLAGDRARMGIKSEDIDLFPARAEILRDGAIKAWLTAQVGRRRAGPDGRTLLEFEGNVLGRSDDQRELKGQIVVYDQKDEKIRSSQPVTLTSTRTRIEGDSLEAHSSFEYGKLVGKVSIDHQGEPRPGESAPAPLKAKGDEADFDFKSGKHELRGRVQVVQGSMRQTSSRVQFLEGERRLVSSGKVDAADGEIGVRCDLLTYGFDSRQSRALGNPSVRQTHADSGEVQEMVAEDILADGIKKSAKGKGKVKVTTWVKKGRALVQDATITADEAETWFDAGRATFKGHVEIRTEKGVSKGEHAVYYKGSRKAYVSGEAEAWEVGARGERVNHIRSEQILYEVESGRATALKGVQGFLGGAS